MNTPSTQIPVNPTSTDTTLTPTPHIISVVVGGILGFLTTKVGVPAEVVPYVTVAVTSVVTTAVHFLLAKITEK